MLKRKLINMYRTKFAITLLLLMQTGFAVVYAATQPRLVLQITVDGLRGDLLNRYQENFGKGGFRYLLDKGVVYTNAHYQHANILGLSPPSSSQGSPLIEVVK